MTKATSRTSKRSSRGGKLDPSETLRKVGDFCLSLPEVEEKISHGARTFFAKKRTFAMFADNHHGDGRIAVWCNASEGGQEILVGSDPDNFFIPPYVGCRGWVGVRVDRGLSLGAISDVIKDAYSATVRAVERKKGQRAKSREQR